MNIIVAVDEKWGIGCNGDLLVKIPDDTAFFRQMTSNKVVVMGHCTFKSLPNSKPLKNRINIVLSKDKNLVLDGAFVCNSIAELSVLLQRYLADDIYIMGGQTLYDQLLPYCSVAYVTCFFAPTNFDPDRFFPNLDLESSWVLENKSEEHTYKDMRYTFNKYVNNRALALKDIS